MRLLSEAVVSLVFAVLCLAAEGAAGVVTNCARLVEISTTNDGAEERFDVTAQAVTKDAASGIGLVVRDGTGAIPLYFTNSVHVADVVPYGTGRFRGWISREFDSAYFFCDGYAFVAPGEPPRPVGEVTSARFMSGECDYLTVSLRGVVSDVFSDENDPRYRYLTLRSGEALVYCAVRAGEGDDMRRLIGAEIVATGNVSPYVHKNRRQIGRTLHIVRAGGIDIVRPAPDDPFAVPEMPPFRREHPSQYALLGRRRANGRVLAVWNGRRMLIRSRSGHVSNVDLSEDQSPPSAGESVEIAGFPETDLYRINFTRAIWRKREEAKGKSEVGKGTLEEAVDVSPDDIVPQTGGVVRIEADFHGRVIRLKGVVAKVPDEGPAFYLDCGGRLVAVESEAADGLREKVKPGCLGEATGVCVMDTENWRPNAPFPSMKGFFVAMRGVDDLRLVESPSWWTAAHVGVIALLLAVAVLAALAWNVTLHRRVNELFGNYRKADAARLASEMRMRERNALATELHDTIAQNLAGAMFHLKTAAMSAKRRGDADTERKVDIASVSLHSCLSQLRDNLWDLRNGLAAGENLADAIAKAAKPHLHGAALHLDIDAGERRFSESFAHAVVCAVREGVINAVRHGGARNVFVSGSRSGDGFAFSVRDDGCGFDVAACPGVDEGHFGLQGARERIRMFGGELELESEPGKGTAMRFAVREEQAPKGDDP